MFLRILAILGAIIAVLFAALVSIGLWIGLNDGPSLEGVGSEDAEQEVRTSMAPSRALFSSCRIAPPHSNTHTDVTSDLEIATLTHFLKSAVAGRLASGSLSSLQPFPAPEIVRLAQPYADWAPKPYSELPPQIALMGETEGQSPPAMFRISHVISGMHGIFTGKYVANDVERSFRVVKAKVCKFRRFA